MVVHVLLGVIVVAVEPQLGRSNGGPGAPRFLPRWRLRLHRGDFLRARHRPEGGGKRQAENAVVLLPDPVLPRLQLGVIILVRHRVVVLVLHLMQHRSTQHASWRRLGSSNWSCLSNTIPLCCVPHAVPHTCALPYTGCRCALTAGTCRTNATPEVDLVLLPLVGGVHVHVLVLHLTPHCLRFHNGPELLDPTSWYWAYPPWRCPRVLLLQVGRVRAGRRERSGRCESSLPAEAAGLFVQHLPVPGVAPWCAECTFSTGRCDSKCIPPRQ